MKSGDGVRKTNSQEVKLISNNMAKITIDVNDFWRGTSRTDFLPDAGYSPVDKGHNLYVTKGLIWPQPKETDIDAISGSDGVVALGFNDSLSPDLKGVSTSGSDGYFYSFSEAGAPTLESTDTGRDYDEYKTDLVFYNDLFHVTSKTDIASLNGSFQAPDYDWWTDAINGAGGSALNALYPHQMIVFNNKLYITDNNVLKSWDGSSAVNAAFTVERDYAITAITEYQKSLYIAADPIKNDRGTYASDKSKVFVWDGVTSTTTWNNEFSSPEKIFSMINYNGKLYAFGTYSLYQWTGVKWINKFDFSNVNAPVYKQKIMKHKNRLYFADGDTIVCYDGQKLSYLFDTNNVSGNISTQIIHSLAYSREINGRETAVISSNLRSVSLLLNNNDGASAYTGESKIRSNRFDFGERVVIKKMILQLGEVMDTATSEIEMSIIDHTGTEIVVGSMDYDNGDRSFKEFLNINIFALSFQVRANWKAYGKPIKSITVFYEPAGRTSKQG